MLKFKKGSVRRKSLKKVTFWDTKVEEDQKFRPRWKKVYDDENQHHLNRFTGKYPSEEEIQAFYEEDY